MSDIAIRVENLSKRYRIGQRERYLALRDVLTDVLYAPIRGLSSIRQWTTDDGRQSSIAHRPSSDNYIWALKDISFEVKQGEVVGIIGRNGSGKTTLLKILARITKPTAGYAEVRGRVGSLLEVGTGFHPELTGRENIYLSGAILGMSKKEIDRKFDEIVAFAEIEKFIDTPVKYYSSGMYVRLAFAVAAHLEPEILLVDEVLAVGDASFQKKCLGKMGDVAREGRTVLFVSHNMSAIARLCKKVLWLEAGFIKQEGEAKEVIQCYLSQGVIQEAAVAFIPESDRDAQILEIELLTSDGKPSTTHFIDSPFFIRIQYKLNRRINRYRLGIRIRLPDGFDVLTSSTTDERGELLNDGPGMYTALVKVPRRLLSPNRYFLTVFLGQPNNRVLDRHENILAFQIDGRAKAYTEPEYGVIATPLKWCLVKDHD